jgi:hypothetical protein
MFIDPSIVEAESTPHSHFQESIKVGLRNMNFCFGRISELNSELKASDLKKTDSGSILRIDGGKSLGTEDVRMRRVLFFFFLQRIL